VGTGAMLMLEDGDNDIIGACEEAGLLDRGDVASSGMVADVDVLEDVL
jgi:hypothetical protein